MSHGALEEAHYRFPPSSAYALNHCLYAIKSEMVPELAPNEGSARPKTF